MTKTLGTMAAALTCVLMLSNCKKVREDYCDVDCRQVWAPECDEVCDLPRPDGCAECSAWCDPGNGTQACCDDPNLTCPMTTNPVDDDASVPQPDGDGDSSGPVMPGDAMTPDANQPDTSVPCSGDDCSACDGGTCPATPDCGMDTCPACDPQDADCGTEPICPDSGCPACDGGDDCDDGASCREGQCVCDGQEPKRTPCLIDDALSVFVAQGAMDGDGSMEKPYGSLGQAIEAGPARIIVCAGTYAESLRLQSAVSIHGGFRCDDAWQHDPDATTLLQGPGPVVTIDAGNASVLLQDLEVVADNATGVGQSSLGVVVLDSDGVTFKGVSITAGNGTDGADGAAPAAQANRASGGMDAIDASGGAGGANTCPDPAGGVITTAGGVGGGGGTSPTPGQQGLPNRDGGGSGGMVGTCIAGSEAKGTDGKHGEAGVLPNPRALGRFEAAQWKPASGYAGEPGEHGQGGGGGAGAGGGLPGGGGGGGAGGCGGAGGEPGEGGGASIALTLDDSRITAIEVTLARGQAGEGGEGQGGQPGQGGGAKGNGTSGSNGCPGGTGGDGGDGGAGTGGPGGLSLGALLVNGSTLIEQTAISHRGSASAAMGGTSPSVLGARGLAQPVHSSLNSAVQGLP